MTPNFGDALALILTYEGGYVDNPRDPGGPTNLGVTQETLCRWRGHPVSPADVKALTRADVAPIYGKRFWATVACDDLPSGVDLIVFDASVNHGPVRAGRFLQAAVGAVVDGQVGPKTVDLVKQHPAAETVKRFKAARGAFYRSLSTFDTFGRGWMRRLDNVAETASAWVGRRA